MSAMVPVLQAIVRDELSAGRGIELGIVTEAFTNEGGSGDSNLAVNVRLRGSAAELQRVPVAVSRSGWSAVPQAGDLVVLGFVGGDLNGAVVLGALYDEQVAAPDAAPDEVVYVVPDAGGSSRRLEIELTNGNTVTILDEEVAIVMGGSRLAVESDGNITLEAAGDLILKAQGAVSVEAGTNVDVAGLAVAVEASAEAKVKGATTTIAGMTSFSAG